MREIGCGECVKLAAVNVAVPSVCGPYVCGLLRRGDELARRVGCIDVPGE